VLGVLLALRLAFDDALPRLLMVAVGGALGLALLVLLLHHLNETRRQENLLAALTQLTNVASEQPSQLPFLAPHLEALLSARCAPTRRCGPRSARPTRSPGCSPGPWKQPLRPTPQPLSPSSASPMRTAPPPREESPPAVVAPPPMRRWLRSWRWILCALLSGGATLAAEVMGARLLRSMLGSTSLAQTAAVSGVLLGLGLGASTSPVASSPAAPSPLVVCW
jgi:hypothetical protein